jgi:hypothetical protein
MSPSEYQLNKKAMKRCNENSTNFIFLPLMGTWKFRQCKDFPTYYSLISVAMTYVKIAQIDISLKFKLYVT